MSDEKNRRAIDVGLEYLGKLILLEITDNDDIQFSIGTVVNSFAVHEIGRGTSSSFVIIKLGINIPYDFYTKGIGVIEGIEVKGEIQEDGSVEWRASLVNDNITIGVFVELKLI